MKSKVDINFKKIRAILKWVWENPYSSFYKDKYKKAGLKSWKEIKNIEDFKKLPFLTRDELVMTDPSEMLFLPRSKARIVGVSSGTIGQKDPLVIFRELPRPEPLERMNKRVLEVMENQKVKVLLRLIPPSGLYRAIQTEVVPHNHSFHIGDITNLPLTARISAKIKIQAITTSPTILSFFIPYLKEQYDLRQIKVIALGGEITSKQHLKLFKKNFPQAQFTTSFGSAEDGSMAYQCDFLPKIDANLLHWNTCRFGEIIEGELISTILIKTLVPLIRYKTGTLAFFKEISCQCGNPEPLIQIQGRVSLDLVRFHGAILQTTAIEKALSKAKEFIYTDNYKLHLFEEMVGNKIIGRIKLQVINKRVNNKEDLVKQISKNLMVSSRYSLADLTTQGVFKPLEIEFVKSFPLEGKTKHIISHIK